MYIHYKKSALSLLQAELEALKLLPEQAPVGDAVASKSGADYQDILDVSKEINFPVNAWVNCLKVPEQASVTITMFEWNTASGLLSARLAVPDRGAVDAYIAAMLLADQPCAVQVRQEELAPNGGYTLSIDLQAILPGQGKS
ncbi:hypothetical protein NBRC116187_35520 [Halopseudomonas sabulinigri]|uniref:Uncharacterized protein n=2 Tax=Halopseudomonas sabulinigri TaxID=472181 RepID=A0ABP9ZUN9_9GAMM